MLATILTLTGCPGPVNTIEPPVWDDGVVTTEPTCTEEGVKTYTCSNGETRTETIPALGHDMGEWEITKNPTCTEKGSKTRKCSRCDETETIEIDALGHDHIVTYSDNICTTSGTKTITCSRCDYSVTENIDTLGHNFGEWSVTTEETCTTNGSKRRVCSRCGHEETKTILAHHTFIAGGCDICGAFEHNATADYQITAYVYSSVEDVDTDNYTTLYFSFPANVVGNEYITFDGEDPQITIDDLIHLKDGYGNKSVLYYCPDLGSLLNKEYKHTSKFLKNLDTDSPVYIVLEPITN